MGVEPLPVETQPQNRSRVRAAQGSVGSCPPWTQANQMGGGFHLHGLLPQLALQVLCD